MGLLFLNFFLKKYSSKCSAFCLYVLFHQLVATIISLSFVDKGGKHCYCLCNINELLMKKVRHAIAGQLQYKPNFIDSPPITRAFQCFMLFEVIVERK